MHCVRLHGAEECFESLLGSRGYTGEICFKKTPREFANYRGGKLTAGNRARHQMVAPHANAVASLSGHFLRIAEYNDAHRRFQPQICLAHRGAQCIAELLKLAECLNGGGAAVVADRFERTELRPDPLIRGQQSAALRHCHQRNQGNKPTHEVAPKTLLRDSVLLLRNTRKFWPPNRGWTSGFLQCLAPRPAALALVRMDVGFGSHAAPQRTACALLAKVYYGSKMLQELIHSARRRLLFNEALKQFAISAALAIGGLALLLTLGTRYLEWWVVALFGAAVIAWAAAKLRKKVPSDYAAAVWLDDKAGLHDSLSTAHYFATRARTLTPEAQAILLAQRGQAEAAASDVNLAIAVPFRFPKALYGLAALLLISSGLVTVRYFFGHELNLSAPITEVIFQDQAAMKLTKAAKRGRNPEKQQDYDEARSLLSKLGLGANLEEKPDEKLDEALAEALKSAEKTPGTGDDAKANQKTDKGDPLELPKDAPNNNNGAQSGENNNNKPGNPGESPGSQSGSKSGEKGDKSLLSKLKDAMDNMLGAPSPQSDKKSGGSKQQSKPSSQAQQSNPQSGEPNEDEDKAAADGEASGNAEKAQSPGKTSGNMSDKQEGPSAAGSEDGEKAIKAAAQIKAMGKISELIGKRSEQVTGESMIEVQSGNQKLQTAYRDKTATHGEGAGEVSRDEIPVSEQAYVQEYFQQVRKPEGKGSDVSAKAKKTTPDQTPAAAKP
jgi:hypothetical protein